MLNNAAVWYQKQQKHFNQTEKSKTWPNAMELQKAMAGDDARESVPELGIRRRAAFERWSRVFGYLRVVVALLVQSRVSQSTVPSSHSFFVAFRSAV